MINWPKPLTGAGAFVAWMARFLAAARQCTPIAIEGYRIEQGSDGFRAQKNFSASSAGGPGKTIDANYKLMAITGLGSALNPPLYDLLICREWNIVGNSFAGGDVFVAKDMESRRTVASEFYADGGDNVKQTYAYFTPTALDATYSDNFRLANDGTNSELQVMEKRYYTRDQMNSVNAPVNQALIYVVDLGVPTGVKDPSNNNITRIEVKPLRVWVRYATQ